jgi:hypothetical protein
MKSKLLALTMSSAFLLCAILLHAETKPDPLSGRYSGTFQGDQFGTLPSAIEFKNAGGTLSGTIAIADTPHGPMSGTIAGTLADGKVSLKFDMGMFKGSITATLSGDTVPGTWTGQEGAGKVGWKKS